MPVSFTTLINSTRITGYTGSSGATGFVGSFGGTGYTGSAALVVKTLDYVGTLGVANGSRKWWINKNYNITRIIGYVETAPTGANLNIRVNKNGANVSLLNIPAASTTATNTVSISVVQGDYITVDVTQVGSTIAGSDLSLIFEYS